MSIQRSFNPRPYSQLTFFIQFFQYHDPCVTPRPKENLVRNTTCIVFGTHEDGNEARVEVGISCRRARTVCYDMYDT